MNKSQIFQQIIKKRSYLCIGLDTDLSKIPTHLHTQDDPVFEFNKQIIDATHELCIAYKINTAFYEVNGVKGWLSLEKTLNYIPKGHFVIADAKRGDIGNTSAMYAKAFFEHWSFDAITVSPYMGEDSVKPFLFFPNKWVIILALTSNEGSNDFQILKLKNNNSQLFEEVLQVSKDWGSDNEIMYVIGASKAEELKAIRGIVPDHFLLIPGVGAQGGSLEEVSVNGMNKQCGVLVNCSRSILYASSNLNFAQASKYESQKIQIEMDKYLDLYL